MSTPPLTATIAPRLDDQVTFLLCAPSQPGTNNRGLVNLVIDLRNTGTEALRVTKIEISVAGASDGPKIIDTDLIIAGGATAQWTQPEDYVLFVPYPPAARLQVRVRSTRHDDAAFFERTLIAHANPTPQGSYRFWADWRDLRTGEFWQVDGVSHGNTNTQLFAYDVGVAARGEDGGHDELLPGGEISKNEHYRIWGKPIYAVADGQVRDFRNDFPTNAVARLIDPAIEKFWKAAKDGGDGQDGNGNFFLVETGIESVLYAHMIPGSLNPALLARDSAGRPSAHVAVGTFLGLAGNSGNSWNPHLHIHASRTRSNPAVDGWAGVGRPMTFRGAYAVPWTHLGANVAAAPWVALAGRGVPPTDCAVWPSEGAPIARRTPELRHFSITTAGQLWAIESDHRIRTTAERLPAFGLYLNVDPGGSAKEVAVRGDQPVVIGMDDKVRQGQSSGWALLGNGPACRRIAVDGDTLWAVTTEGRVARCALATGSWSELVGPLVLDLCARNGAVYAILASDNRIQKRSVDGTWASFGGEGKGKRIAIDRASGTLWVIAADGTVWHHAGNGNWVEHPGGGRGQDIQVHDGVPHILGTNAALWRSAGASGWQQLNLTAPV